MFTVSKNPSEVAAQGADGDDDYDCDEADHDAVFDSGGALFFAAEADHEVGVKRKHFVLLSESDGWPCTSSKTKLATLDPTLIGSCSILR